MRKRIRSGVYQITNEINGKFYVGSSKNIDHRWSQHRKDAPTYKHRSLLYAAMRKYGIENFTFLVLEECELVKATLLAREQHYIDILNPAYNLMPLAGSRLGSKQSEETNRKVGEAVRHRWTTMTPEEYAEACSCMGYEWTDEQRAAQGERVNDWYVNLSPEEKEAHRQHCVKASNSVPLEVKQEQMSKRSKKNWETDREKMMDAVANRVTSPEGKQRQRDAVIKWNEEHADERAATMHANWADPVIRDKMLNAPNRVAAVKAAWNDPEKRARMSSNHTGPTTKEGLKKCVTALDKWRQENKEKFAEQARLNLAKAQAARAAKRAGK